jgi:hypothetical protein
MPQMCRKNDDFSLFHSPRICFRWTTSGNRTIQFYILHWNIFFKYLSICECVSPENVGSMLLDVHWQHETSQFDFVTSKNEELGFTRYAQLPCSFNLAPCDFFLFGYLKKELHEKNLKSQNEVISVVRAILTKSPIQTLSQVFDEWIEGLHRCIANEEEYL